jgi:hypothetical protein
VPVHRDVSLRRSQRSVARRAAGNTNRSWDQSRDLGYGLQRRRHHSRHAPPSLAVRPPLLLPWTAVLAPPKLITRCVLSPLFRQLRPGALGVPPSFRPAQRILQPVDLLPEARIALRALRPDQSLFKLVRVGVSLKNRVAPPEIVVERLAYIAPADRLAKALTAYGRIIKTIYILRYIQDEKIRRVVQLQLNRGETRHSLTRWLFFANRGEFRDGDLNEIMNKTSCLSLLCNATVVWNTIRMPKIVDQLRNSGQTARDENLARIWPLLHEHILPNGIDDFAGC